MQGWPWTPDLPTSTISLVLELRVVSHHTQCPLKFYLFLKKKKKGQLQIIDVPHRESEGLRGFPGSKDYDKPWFTSCTVSPGFGWNMKVKRKWGVRRLRWSRAWNQGHEAKLGPFSWKLISLGFTSVLQSNRLCVLGTSLWMDFVSALLQSKITVPMELWETLALRRQSLQEWK